MSASSTSSNDAAIASASLAGRCSIIMGNIFCCKHASLTSSRCSGRSRAVLLIITLFAPAIVEAKYRNMGEYTAGLRFERVKIVVSAGVPRRRRLTTQPRVTPWESDATEPCYRKSSTLKGFHNQSQSQQSIPDVSLIIIDLVSSQEFTQLILKRDSPVVSLLATMYPRTCST